MRRGRLRDLAVLLPLGAVLLFVPPYILMFDQPIRVLGIPLWPLAIFGLWLIGIGLTAALARALDRAEPEPPAGHTDRPDDGPDEGPDDRSNYAAGSLGDGR